MTYFWASNLFFTSVTIFLFFSNSGPESWHKEFPVAKEGKRQSPIDIIPDDTVDATSASKEKPLKWTYGTKHCMNIGNTGSSWKVNVNGCGSCKF